MPLSTAQPLVFVRPISPKNRDLYSQWMALVNARSDDLLGRPSGRPQGAPRNYYPAVQALKLLYRDSLPASPSSRQTMTRVLAAYMEERGGAAEEEVA